MLTVAQLLAFNLALLLALIAPGPAFLVCVQASLRGGRREGVLTGLGLGVMAGLWTLAALAGLDTVFRLFPFVYTAMRVGGAILVIVFAVLMWRGATSPVETAAPVSPHRAFLRGFALNLGNPKSILFAAGVLLVIFPPGLSPVEMALIVGNQIALEVAVYAALATLMSRAAVRTRYLAFKPLIGRATAIVLGGLGLRLLVTT
ncbi:LysE family translocator [Jannaschia rubra]|uniref:LysE family translocator n=1 Tax=Jannaschia rubra TaxID=282197 RepID=UPI002492BCCD|nr:LysE family transporter [Jannaschia rubra]